MTDNSFPLCLVITGLIHEWINDSALHWREIFEGYCRISGVAVSKRIVTYVTDNVNRNFFSILTMNSNSITSEMLRILVQRYLLRLNFKLPTMFMVSRMYTDRIKVKVYDYSVRKRSRIVSFWYFNTFSSMGNVDVLIPLIGHSNNRKWWITIPPRHEDYYSEIDDLVLYFKDSNSNDLCNTFVSYYQTYGGDVITAKIATYLNLNYWATVWELKCPLLQYLIFYYVRLTTPHCGRIIEYLNLYFYVILHEELYPCAHHEFLEFNSSFNGVRKLCFMFNQCLVLLYKRDVKCITINAKEILIPDLLMWFTHNSRWVLNSLKCEYPTAKYDLYKEWIKNRKEHHGWLKLFKIKYDLSTPNIVTDECFKYLECAVRDWSWNKPKVIRRKDLWGICHFLSLKDDW